MSEIPSDIHRIAITPVYPMIPSSQIEITKIKSEDTTFFKSKVKKLLIEIRAYALNFISIDLEQEGSFFSGFYGILTVLIVVISSFIITLIPQQDIVKHPKYWPERMLRIIWFHVASFLSKNFDYMLLMGGRYPCTTKQSVYMCLINIGFAIILFFLSHVIWIYPLHLRPPIPLIGLLYLWAHLITLLTSHWYHDFLYGNNDFEQRRRFKWSAMAMSLVQFLGIIYYFATGLFEKLPEEQQPVLAFVMAMIRYGSQKLLEVPTFRTGSENQLSLQFFIGCKIICNHALCLTIIIGSSATELTSYLLFSIDVIIGLKSCYDIVHLHRVDRFNIINEQANIRNIVQKLVLKETLQILIPMTYSIILCLSYFGPNAQFYGTGMIEDISIPLKKVAILMLVDMMLLIFSSIILWRYCKIILVQEYFQLMESYWKPITFSISAILLAVSK